MHITYEPLSEAYLTKLSMKMSLGFAERESMARVLKIKPRELQKLFFPLMQDSLEHSYIAKDRETNDVIGGIICNDFTFFMNSHGPAHISIKLNAILSLLTTLENSFLEQSSGIIKKRDFLYQYLIYVDKNYTGKKIATNLCKMSIKSAKKRNFKNIISIPTGPISQCIYINKLKFKKLNEIAYADYQFEGKNVFSCLGATSCALVMNTL